MAGRKVDPYGNQGGLSFRSREASSSIECSQSRVEPAHWLDHTGHSARMAVCIRRAQLWHVGSLVSPQIYAIHHWSPYSRD